MQDIAVSIAGNLTADPELRFTASGVAVASFTIAHTPRRPDGSGGYADGETLFLRCTTWRNTAENAAESLSKGARVVAMGTIGARSWEDAKTGENRTSVEMTVEELGVSLKYATVNVHKATRTQSAPVTDPVTGEAATERIKPGTAAPAASPR